MTDENRVELVAENASIARKIWSIIKANALPLVLGGLAGAALYGTVIVLTGAPARIMEVLASMSVIGAIGVVSKRYKNAKEKVKTRFSRSSQPEQDSRLQEDQVIVLDTRAMDVRRYGLDIVNALSLVGISQFYWVGTVAEWQHIEDELHFSAKLNTCPEDDMERVMVVYTVKAPKAPIQFSKGDIMGFLRNYTPPQQGEVGSLYLHPDVEGDIMRYGFKAE